MASGTPSFSLDSTKKDRGRWGGSTHISKLDGALPVGDICEMRVFMLGGISMCVCIHVPPGQGQAP